jgi:hypothetical protein
MEKDATRNLDYGSANEIKRFVLVADASETCDRNGIIYEPYLSE